MKGFIIEIASLIAIVAGVYGAIHFSYFISEKLNLTSEYSPLISFAITFILIVVVIFLLANLLKSMNLLALGFFNKFAGAFFSMLKFAFILSILLLIIDKASPGKPLIPEKARKVSKLNHPISIIAPYIIPKLVFEEIQKKFETAPVEKDSLDFGD